MKPRLIAAFSPIAVACFTISANRRPAYHEIMDLNEQMRSDWNRRAREAVNDSGWVI